MSFPFLAFSQSDYKPFAEAEKSIGRLENEQKVYDSLRRDYHRKWTLNFIYGQRGISAENRRLGPDTLTFADFTSRRSFYGLGGGYFVKPNLMLTAEMTILILPMQQDISSFSFGANGISVEGRGNGGVEINIKLGARYFFRQNKPTRPYAGIALGRVNLIAKGGEISINGSSRNDTLEEAEVQMMSTSFIGGITHRASPGFMLDFNLGYALARENQPIGGITGTGGWTSSLALQFILNPKTKSKTTSK